MNTVDLSKIYPVFFKQGSSGTFLTYFINLHNNFKTAELINVGIQYNFTHTTPPPWNEGTIVYHTRININSWRWQDTKFNNEYFLDYFNRIAENKKIAVKMLPHDYINLNTPQSGNRDISQIIDYVKHMNPIIVYLSNGYFNLVHNRNIKNSVVTGDTYKDYKKRIIDLANTLDKHNVSYHILNLEKIMQLDHKEYLKLLQFINSDPLDDWKTEVLRYKKLIGIE